jgi:hypothetical protein
VAGCRAAALDFFERVVETRQPTAEPIVKPLRVALCADFPRRGLAEHGSRR